MLTAAYSSTLSVSRHATDVAGFGAGDRQLQFQPQHDDRRLGRLRTLAHRNRLLDAALAGVDGRPRSHGAAGQIVGRGAGPAFDDAGVGHPGFGGRTAAGED
jgi:hypothetical protein